MEWKELTTEAVEVRVDHMSMSWYVTHYFYIVHKMFIDFCNSRCILGNVLMAQF